MAWAEPTEDAGASWRADFSFDDENDAMAGGNAKASGNYTRQTAMMEEKPYIWMAALPSI